jgi:hypothetical protein
MGTSTYDPCLLITAADSECFGVVGMQTDDTLGFSNTAFANKESDKLRFMAKEKQSLKTGEPLIFNGCVLTVEGDILHLRQKNQGQKLKLATDKQTYVQQRARGAYIAIICQPEASFDLSAAAQIADSGKEEIARLNKRMKWQMANINHGLDYIAVNLKFVKLFAIVDALFANNKNLSSEMGYVIILGNERATNEFFIIIGNLMHWLSVKCKRITKSVLVDSGIPYGSLQPTMATCWQSDCLRKPLVFGSHSNTMHRKNSSLSASS